MVAVVELMVGPPCSGKSTRIRETASKNDFIISRDDIRNKIIEGTEFVYSDYFVKPKEGEKVSSKYGGLTDDGQWTKVAKLNQTLLIQFNETVEQAKEHLREGGKVVVDLVNLSRKERDTVKEWFSDIEGVRFDAVVTEHHKNLPLIEEMNALRAEKENKFIPFFVIESMIEKSDPIEVDEFKNVTYIDGFKDLKLKKSLEQKEPSKKADKTNTLKI